MIGSFIQGGLGNQLFQVAAGVAHAKRVGTTFSVIEGQHHLPLQGNNISTYKDNILRDVDSLPYDSFLGNEQVHQEGHHYTPLPMKDNLFLVGYFQSEKYFEDCKEDIADLFSMTPEIEELIEEQYPYLKDEKVVALHVRRGDYLLNPGIFGSVDLSYYERALDSIEDKDRVLIFSDDVAWCRETFGEGYSFSVLDKDYLDLYTMSKCHHHILANSTFSWWGAWLSKTDGRIIAPKNWFGPSGPEDTQDMLPEGWEEV